MSRARNGLALLAAAGAGVGALLRRRRPSDGDDDNVPSAAAPAAPESPASPAGEESVMTYSSPGQVANYEEAHGGGMNWAATGGMTAPHEASGVDTEESAPEPPSDGGT